jgi:small subunit ribosomal protein S6
MFIFDSNRYARDPGGVSSKVTEIVEKLGGEVLANRLWNEQKLAYPIKGHRKGVYWLSYVRMESTQNSKLNREIQLNESILRHLVVKIDPRLVDTLVAIARGERTAVEEETSEEPEAVAAEI